MLLPITAASAAAICASSSGCGDKVPRDSITCCRWYNSSAHQLVWQGTHIGLGAEQ